MRVTLSAGRTLGVGAVARVLADPPAVDGVAAVDDVTSACAVGSDDFELHALANISVMTKPPAMGENFRITALVYPAQRRIASHQPTLSPSFYLRTRRATDLGGVAWLACFRQMKLGIAVSVISLVSALLAPTVAWPGTTAVRVVDQADALGGNISGLAVAGPSSLWAVRDAPSALLKLDRTSSGWVPSSESGSARALRYSDGSGSPDAEAVTTVAGDDAVVYVGAERDNDKPSASRNSILRFDTSSTGTLRATRQWELSSVLPATGANTGIEGLTWIPDDALVAMGLRDTTGNVYAPADHPGHGKGLFVVGLEENATLYVVALRDDGGVAVIASMPSGLNAVMDVVWSAARQELWVVCDNTCGGSAAVFRPSAGSLVLSLIVQPPQGMASLNNEGFALGPSCAEGAMAAIWADDSASAGHVLRETTLDCSASASIGTPPIALPSSQPSVASRPSEDPPSEDPPSDRSLVVVVGLGLTLAIAAAAVTALVRRTRFRR